MTHVWNKEVPILLVIFNRPDKTRQVFEAIREAQPQKLFIAADGPRTHVDTDEGLCQQTREVVTNIDWDCQVATLFREENSGGSGPGVSQAISWFFDQVEEGIILEDDCVPSQSFFYFCQEMLRRYQDDQRVMHISGSNFQFGKVIGTGTYYFSRVNNVWGWATWRRAWQHFDYDMKLFPEFVEQKIIESIHPLKSIQEGYLRTFANAYHNIWNCWDRRWMFAIYRNNGLSIIPNKNLISNIGYGANASAEYYQDDPYISMPNEEITKIVHPSFVVPNRQADEYHHTKVFVHPPLAKRIRRKIIRMTKHL